MKVTPCGWGGSLFIQMEKNDQPKPATDESIPLHKQDGKWKFGNKQPKPFRMPWTKTVNASLPTGGEWTLDRLREYGLSGPMAQVLANDINAALAEQKQDLWQKISCSRIEADNWKYLYEKNEKQLAAERELREASESGGIQTMWKESRTIVELRQQLAAERERANENADAMQDYGNQLAAEKESYIALCDKANGDMIALNKQLAAEKEKYAAQREDWIAEIQQLQEKVDKLTQLNIEATQGWSVETVKVRTLQDALERIRDVAIKTDWELAKQIDTALAKVNP